MTQDELLKAKALNERRDEILRELITWEKDLINGDALAYVQDWNKGFCQRLGTHVSEEIFQGFRCAAMDNLKLQLANVEREFADL